MVSNDCSKSSEIHPDSSGFSANIQEHFLLYIYIAVIAWQLKKLIAEMAGKEIRIAIRQIVLITNAPEK